MSLYVACVLCIFLCILGKITEKKIFNPVTSFYALWAIILILNSLQLFNIKETRSAIYDYILYGLIAYAVGFYIIRGWSRKYKIVIRKKFNRSEQRYNIRYKFLYILCIIALVILMIDLKSMLSILLSGGGLALVRYTAQNSEISRSGIVNAIDVLIATPLCLALQPIVAVDFWLGKRDKKLIFLDLVLICTRVLAKGGRSPIIYLTLNMVIVYTFMDIGKRNGYSEKIKKYIKESKKLILTIFVVGFSILIYTTLSRESTWSTIYYYFAMEPYMFDSWSVQVDSAKLFGYGLASLNGFFFALFYFIKNFLRLGSFPQYWYSIYQMIALTDSQWQVITPGGTRANAYVSLFWFFYLDGRVLGIIIGCFLYGIIMSCLYSEVIKRGNMKNICLYSFMMQGLLFSFVRMQLSSIYYAIAVIMICFIAFKKINKKSTISEKTGELKI